jgi:ATP-dependent DNA ligase
MEPPVPVTPPLKPMLARLASALPVDPPGGWRYEPKWDGFRCLVFRSGPSIDLRSRNDRPLARYFPELVEALLAVECESFVLDGEILMTDFAALMARLHPAPSRVERLRRETPASFVAFDLLAAGDDDLRGVPFGARRRRLEALLRDPPKPLFVTPSMGDAAAAAAWLADPRPGIDGVVAKPVDLDYQPGRRVMVKVKRERTADCVVAGFRWALDRPVVASLLLGLYDDASALRHVGVAASFPEQQRAAMVDELFAHATELAGHPWEHGMISGPNPTGRLAGSASRWTPEMALDWVPLRPWLVCEVAYTQLDVDRFRHAARFVRWRPDRSAESCTLEQFS